MITGTKPKGTQKDEKLDMTHDNTGFLPYTPDYYEGSDYYNPATGQFTQRRLADFYHKSKMEVGFAARNAQYDPRLSGSASLIFVPENTDTYKNFVKETI
jgi:hypothetical protein